jgi:hypothetical protein
MLQTEKRMTNNELFEYWFIRMIGSTDEYDFEFAKITPLDDYDCDNESIYIKCADYETCSDNFSFISATPENKHMVCFDLFGFMFY